MLINGFNYLLTLVQSFYRDLITGIIGGAPQPQV